MNPFEMVVLIIAIVMIANVIKSRNRARYGLVDDKDGVTRVVADADAERLRDEVRGLKERIAVLERLVTDDNGARALDREIEKLR